MLPKWHFLNHAPAGNPADRFSLSRLIEAFPPPPAPVQPRATWPEAVAVYTVLGWRPRDGDILAPPGDRAPALLRNRYIRLWIFRHRHFPAKQLIATLVEAVDIARDRNQDTVLPELSPDCALGGAATSRPTCARDPEA